MKEKVDKYEKKLKEYFSKLKIEINPVIQYAFFAAIIIGLLAHFTLYAEQITVTDGLTFGSRFYAGGWEISLGRWFIVVLNKLRYGLVSPAYITFLSVFILGISSILIVDTFEIKKKFTAVLTSACIILAPFVYETLLIQYTADAYFIAWLLAVLAVFMYKRKNKIFFVTSIVLLMAIYQSYINVVMFLGLALIILKVIDNKYDIEEAAKEFFIYYTLCFIGILLYYIVTQIILKVTGIELSSYGGASSNSILSIIQNLPKGILKTFNRTYGYYFSDIILNNTVYNRGILYAIMFIFIAINIVLMQKDKAKLATIICFVLMAPIMLCFVEVIIISRKINVIMSASLICPILIFIKFIDMQNKYKLFKYLEIALVSIILYTYAIMGEATYISMQKNYEQVHSKLITLVDKIEGHDEFEKGMKVVFLGEFEYFNHLDVYDISTQDFRYLGVFLSVQNATLRGIFEEKFATEFEVYDVQAESWNKYAYYTTEAIHMRPYPNDDCIKVIDNVMIVKLSD